MHVGLTNGSSIYLIKYVLFISIFCCSLLGYWLLYSGDSILNDQSD